MKDWVVLVRSCFCSAMCDGDDSMCDDVQALVISSVSLVSCPPPGPHQFRQADNEVPVCSDIRPITDININNNTHTRIHSGLTGDQVWSFSLFQTLLRPLLCLPECFHQKRFCDESQNQNVPLGVFSLRRLQETSGSVSAPLPVLPILHSSHGWIFFS